MIHPDTELRFVNEHIGFGLFATKRIPRGTITWVRDPLDQVFPRTRLAQLPPMLQELVDKYSFVNGAGEHVLCWDLARFVNHSCEPTCLSAGYDFEIAVRDLEPGEELTDDYGSLNVEAPFACACGSARCREKVLPGDLLRYGDAWDRIVEPGFRLINTVRQPLRPLVTEWAEVEAAIDGRTPIVSIKKHNYEGFVTPELRQAIAL